MTVYKSGVRSHCLVVYDPIKFHNFIDFKFQSHHQIICWLEAMDFLSTILDSKQNGNIYIW